MSDAEASAGVHATRKAVAEGRARLRAGMPSKHACLFEDRHDCTVSDSEITHNVLSYDSDNPYGSGDISHHLSDPDYTPHADDSSENLLKGLSCSDDNQEADGLSSADNHEADSPTTDGGDLTALRNEVKALKTAVGKSGEPAGHRIDLSKVVDKPDKFTGADYNVKHFNNWVLKLSQYIELLDVPAHKRVGVAATYLDGDALSWWTQKKQTLQKDGTDITSMTVFVDTLRERFSFKNPEQAARVALRSFTQGNMSVTEYINQFDSYYSYLPTWDEADKIDRFTAGLHRRWQERVIINPTTGRRWKEYYPMINYLVSLLHESPAGALQDDLHTRNGAQPHINNQSNTNNTNNDRTDRQHTRQRQNPRWQRRGRDRQRAARARNGRGPGGNPNRKKFMENANKKKFWRTVDQMSYIISRKKGMCACCYEHANHTWADCTTNPVFAPPPGYIQHGTHSSLTARKSGLAVQ